MDVYITGTNLTVQEYQAQLDREEQAEASHHGLTLDELRMAKRTGMSPERYAAFKGVRTVRDMHAVDHADDRPSPFAELERKREQDLVARGEPRGLSAEEVEAADRTGTDLASYAALKDVRSIEDWRRLREHEALMQRAAEQARLEQAVDAARRGTT